MTDDRDFEIDIVFLSKYWDVVLRSIQSILTGANLWELSVNSINLRRIYMLHTRLSLLIPLADWQGYRAIFDIRK